MEPNSKRKIDRARWETAWFALNIVWVAGIPEYSETTQTDGS